MSGESLAESQAKTENKAPDDGTRVGLDNNI